MSELVVLTTAQSATIYGSYAAAGDYAATMFGTTYAAWRALLPDDQKRTLIAAARFIDAQAWDTNTAATMAIRDAIAAFPQASYELAVLIADDPSVLQTLDQGTNVRVVGAGSARVEFFNPSSAVSGTAPIFPPVLMRLIGRYLALSVISTGGAPDGQACSSDSPFSSTADYLGI